MSSHTEKKHLLFFMTPGVSLAHWNELGILKHEIQPLLFYNDNGWDITIADYGSDKIPDEIPEKIKVIKNAHHYFIFMSPFYLHKALMSATVLRTNQSYRSWWYIALAKLYNKPILLRSGWTPGKMYESQNFSPETLPYVRAMEGWAFRNATMSQVSTEMDRSWIIKRYHVDESKIRVMGNLINHKLFTPEADTEALDRSVLYIGRIEHQKNLPLLMDACQLADASQLTIVGDGSLKSELKKKASSMKLDVQFIDRISQHDIPKYHARSQVFALSSIEEGHPKSLLEAMSSGMPCVGTNVAGIKNTIAHLKTGLVCENEAESMADALKCYFSDSELRTKIGENARIYIQDNYDFITNNIIF